MKKSFFTSAVAALFIIAAVPTVVSAAALNWTVTPANMQGWVPDDNRGTGSSVIDSTNPRSGNGSLQLSLQNSTDKATMALGWNPTTSNPFGVQTTLGNFGSFAFDWFKSSSSTNTPGQTTAFRLYFLNDSNGNGTVDPGEKWGSLVYEFAYNGDGHGNYTAPTDSWQTTNLLTSYLWQRAAGTGGAGNLDGTFGGVDGTKLTLADWLNPSTPKPTGAWTLTPTTEVIGIELADGSGWAGTSSNAVDNPVVGFVGGNTITSNFEQTSTPEPTGTVFIALGAMFASFHRQRKS